MLAGLVVFLAVPLAAHSQSTAVNAALEEASTLLLEERFDEALAIMRPLALANPGNDDVVFLTGLAAMERARRTSNDDESRAALLDEAIALFRALLVSDPALVRVRLELARAFFFKEEDGLAKQHFERVLAGDVPEAVKANVNRFLSIMRARRRWNMHFGFALQPDNNIGGASNERIIYILGLPFERDVDELTTSGIGLSLWTGGEYQYPLQEQPVQLRLGGRVSRKEYKGGEFDEMSLSAYAGPRWLASPNTDLSLLANLSQRWVQDKVDNDEWGTSLELGTRLSPRFTANLRPSLSRRQYRDKTHLDGTLFNLNLGGTWIPMPILKVDATVGYARENTKSDKWRNSSRSIGAGMQVALPRGFTVGGNVRKEWKGYGSGWGVFTPAGGPRKDQTRTLSVSLHNRGLTLLGFSPQLILSNDVRKSNAQLHGYRRNRGELQFVRQF